MRGRALGRGTIRSRVGAGGKVVYQAEYRDAQGYRRRVDLSSDRRTAERMLSEIIRRRDLIRQGMGQEDSSSAELAALAKAYLDSLAASVKPGRVSAVQLDLEELFEALDVKRAGQVDAEAVLALRAQWVREKRLSNATINRKFGALRSLFRWALRARLVALNPLDGIARLPVGRAHEKRPRRPLTEAEATRFLEAAEKLDEELSAFHAAEKTITHGTKGAIYAKRDRAPYVRQAPLFRALLFTGARVGELVAATWADFDPRAGLLTLRASTTKNARARIIPLRPEVVEDARRLKAELGRIPGQGDPVYLTPAGEPWGGERANLLKRLERILERAGIDKRDVHGRSVGLHSLRHTAGTLLAKAGASLIDAQKILGHSDPKLTAALYVHTSGEDLRKAIDLLPGLTKKTRQGKPKKGKPDATIGQ